MESPFWKQFPGQSRGIFSYFITALTAYLLPFLLSFYFSCMEMESLKMMETVAIMVVICLFSVWFIGFTGHERSWILNIAKSKLYR